MGERFILALDQGTTSSRALLVDETGAIRATAQRPFRQIFPRPGWVEHDPVEIWSSQIGTAAEVLAHAGVEPGAVAAVGVANQRETTVLWDRRTGEPVANAIVWQDRRTAEFCDGLRREGKAELIQERTGLLPDAYFSGSKLRWLLDNVPGVRTRAERGELAFGTVDTWLLWKMTEGQRHVTDVTNASRTMLWNLQRMEWDDELLALLGVPRAVLPEVVSSSGVCGEVRTGLSAGAELPVAGIAGDQQAALFGQMCVRPGMVKCTFGTGSFMLLHTGDRPMRSKKQLLTTMGWRLGGGPAAYALEGSMLMAGAVVQWLRDGLEIIRSADEVEALAQSVPDTGGVVLVPAFAGLGAPHWDQGARGAIVGMTRGTTKAHIARAALESIALQVVDVLEAMEADSGLRIEELRVDGGAAANDTLMQLQADLLQCRVVRPKNTEATAMGAAYLAGLGVGMWKGIAELERGWAVDRVFEPRMKASEREAMRERWARALGRAGGWV